jgi:L-amino acid N-acyltransferase YncA
MTEPLASCATLPPYTLREIPPSERRALQVRGVLPPILPADESSFILVETAGGSFVGRWMALDAVVLEGLYIAPEYRGKFGAAKKLLYGMLDRLRQRKIREVVTLIQDPMVERLAEKAGFTPLAGRLWRKEL